VQRYDVIVIGSRLAGLAVCLRHESRGLHFSLDYPGTLESAADTVLTPPRSSYAPHPRTR